MFKPVIKLFIKNPSDASDPGVRAAYGKMSGTVGIICNLLLFTAKLVSAVVSGSVSIAADAVNNLSDASSSVISLLGFKMSDRPADAEHPYGHGRYEYLSGLFVSVLIIVIGFELLKTGIEKIITPTPVEFSAVSAVILLLSMGAKLWMMLFNRKIGRLIGSGALAATAADSRNDVITSAAVLTSGLISHFTRIELDGWTGMLVAAFILYSGFGLIRDTLDPLLGRAPDAELVEKIRKTILSYPGVLGTHDLLIHDYGPGRQFASVHVEMAAEGDVIASHDVIDNIERDFLTKMGVHMIVHFDPISTSDSFTDEMRVWLSEHIKSINPLLTIHDLRVVHGTTHTNLIFDCAVPPSLSMPDSELKRTISELVQSGYPACYTVVTIDRNYAAMPHQL